MYIYNKMRHTSRKNWLAEQILLQLNSTVEITLLKVMRKPETEKNIQVLKGETKGKVQSQYSI